jgi:hypothetical protein
MNAIAFWYEIGTAPAHDSVYSTYSAETDAHSSNGHFKQAVYLLDAAVEVKPHTRVAVEIRGQYATIMSVNVT